MYLLTCPLTPGQQRGLLDARTGRPALSSPHRQTVTSPNAAQALHAAIALACGSPNGLLPVHGCSMPQVACCMGARRRCTPSRRMAARPAP